MRRNYKNAHLPSSPPLELSLDSLAYKWNHEVHNRRKYMDLIAQHFGIVTYEDWYGLSRIELKNTFNFTPLLNKNYSVAQMLKEVYPEFEWDSQKFRDLEIVAAHRMKLRNAFDKIASDFGIQKQEEWYQLTSRQVQEEVSLDRWDGSLFDSLMEAYPEFVWEGWRFDRSPQGQWATIENQRTYVDWIRTQLGVEKLEDWYKVSGDQFKELGGSGLLSTYNGSLVKLLQSVYPEMDWHPWLFAQAPKEYWDNNHNARKCFDWLSAKLNISNPSDWNGIKLSVIRQYKASGLIQHHGSLVNALQAAYPEYLWKKFFSLSVGASQVLQTLYERVSKEDVLINYRHPELIHSASKRTMELDFYIPSMKLAFEYQGLQHYVNKGARNRDLEKQQACIKMGITLVEIPFWASTTRTNLKMTLRRLLQEANNKRAETPFDVNKL